MVKCVYKYEVAYCGEDAMACLDWGVLEVLDNNNKDGFYVDFLLVHPL